MEKWLDDLYQAQEKKYAAIPLQPTDFIVVSSGQPQEEAVEQEPVYAEYFGCNDWNDDENARAPNAWSEFPPEDTGDLEFIYVIDLDRDAFSVDLRAHFRLSNLREDWRRHLGLDEEHRRAMPTGLGVEFLAWNVFAPEPVLDEKLLAVFKGCEVLEIEAPTPPRSQWLKSAIMWKLTLGLTSMLRNVLDNTWREYGPTDVRMQKIIYAFVKCCCWESLSFSPTTRDLHIQEGNSSTKFEGLALT